MKISKDKMVKISYTLKNSAGDVIDSSENNEPLEYIHGYNKIIPGLERALLDHDVDDVLSVVVDPADAYGDYDKTLVITVPKSQFDTDVEIETGMQFQADSPSGSRIVTVIDVKDDQVVIDANHPLAGEKLFFDVTVVDIRDATREEIFIANTTGSGSCSEGCDSCGNCSSCSGNSNDSGCNCGGCESNDE